MTLQIHDRGRTLWRSLVVLAMVALFAGVFMFFWRNAGGSVPGLTSASGQRLVFRAGDIKTLQVGSDASIAGVVVGSVEGITSEQHSARVVVTLDPDAPQLHQGTTVRVGMESLLGQSYVDIIDGHGPPLPENAVLASAAVTPAVGIDEVLRMLPARTREELRGTLRSLGAATGGTSGQVSQLMSGLGQLGREGHTALDAIAAQSEDLKSLTSEATVLLNALDTGQGRIADVVRDANVLVNATSGQRQSIERTMRKMPRLLGTARTAMRDLHQLSGALAPVASNLRSAAPDLNHALLQMPSVSRDLRGLLPPLNGTLQQAPATLQRVPTLGSDVRRLVPQAHVALRDVNPMLAYLRPYGRDLGALFANFGASMDMRVENGIRPIRLGAILNSGSVRGVPVQHSLDPRHWTNPYPRPGQAGNPEPWSGRYPRVERAPR